MPSAPTGGTYIVNSAQGTAPQSVDLSSMFNTSGIYAMQVAGTAVPNGGLDGKGDALAENLTGTTVSWSGGTYVIGLAGQSSGASSTTISASGRQLSRAVNFLAVGVDGNQTDQIFTLELRRRHIDELHAEHQRLAHAASISRRVGSAFDGL